MQAGPCRDAYDTGEVVRVTDVRQESTRWPDFSDTAIRVGVAGVAGIPMRLAGETIGALNIDAAEPREWSDEDIAVAVVLADVATSYVINASKLRQQEQLSEQLQGALESRVVIEQAKGITAQQNSVSIDQAYQRMRGHARSNNTSRGGRGGDRCRRASGLSPTPCASIPVSHRRPTSCPQKSSLSALPDIERPSCRDGWALLYVARMVNCFPPAGLRRTSGGWVR